MSSYYAYALCTTMLGALSIWFLMRRNSPPFPLPPGPPPHIITGNSADIPAENQWEAFARLGNIYGPIIHLRVLNKRIIVLNSLEDVTELLNKRGSIYSDRPAMTMVCEVMGWGWQTSLMPYGDMWRSNRRAIHYFFHEGASEKYRDLQTQTNLEFVRALLHSPSAFMQHIHHLTASSILKLTYGMEGDELDRWVNLADECIEILTAAVNFGTYAVDYLPILKHIPSWFPGASFQKLAQKAREMSDQFRYGPLEWVKQKIMQGSHGVSIAERLMQDGLEGRPISEETLADVTAILYIGGSDTTVSVISAFFLCMVLHPEVQKAAQDEIDCVLGHGSLPSFADRDSLPYVNGVLLETMRLYPVLPLGLYHRVMEDDEYKGMRIPKDATILANVWAILRDKDNYRNPGQFIPERYTKDGVLDLKNTEPDPRGPLFGFGRRVCPGRHFADATAWLAIATTLACFDIVRARDNDGNEIVPEGKLRTGALTYVVPHPQNAMSLTKPMRIWDSCVRPFQCIIKPRSEATKKLLVEVTETI